MEEDIDRKEVVDALHMLLHCALKDKEFETQKEQFDIVMNYIKELEEENKRIKSIDYYKVVEDIETGQYIPKSKVKEKIEEYKRKMEKDVNYLSKDYFNYRHKIYALQELLEG